MYELSPKGELVESVDSQAYDRTADILESLAKCFNWIYTEPIGDYPADINIDPDISFIVLPNSDKPLVCQTQYLSGPAQTQARTQPFALDVVSLEIAEPSTRMVVVRGEADYTHDLALCFSFKSDASPAFVASDTKKRQLKVSLTIRESRVILDIY